MKLYTLEEIKETLKSIDCEEVINVFIENADPIELPSDEDIEESIIEQDVVRQQGYCHCFLDGAKWMKEQILNQNK